MGGDDSTARTLLAAGEWDPDGADAVTPHPDDLFPALADATRRHVTWYLLDESPATVHELADVVAGWRLGDRTAVDPDEHENVVATLHHTHLPVLDDADIVDYHSEQFTVEATALAPVVEDVVQFANAYDAAVPDQR